MSKVVKSVVRAIPAAVVAWVASGFNPMAPAAVLASAAVAGALTKTPKLSGLDQARTITLSSGQEPQRVVYGEQRVPTLRVFAASSSDGVLANGYLHQVLALARTDSDGVEAIGDVYFNDEVVPLVPSGDGYVPTPGHRLAGAVYIEKLTGATGQAAPATLLAADLGWTAAHQLQGVAALYVRMRWDSKTGPDTWPTGLPQISAVVKGQKVMDPRTGQKQWSDNFALCLRDMLLADHGYACRPEEVDDANMIAAANLCDEDVALDAGGTQKRYTLNAIVALDGTPGDAVDQLLGAGMATLAYARGSWRLFPAAYAAPTPGGLVLTADHLRGEPVIDMDPPREAICNTVKGRFIAPDQAWAATDFPQIQDAALLAKDGEAIESDIDLPAVTDAARAQRLAKIVLRRSRRGTVQWPGTWACLTLRVGDTVPVTLAVLGWVEKPFRVESWELAAEGGIDLLLREEVAADYAWTAAEEQALPAPPRTTLPDPAVVAMPSAFTALAQTKLLADGSVLPIIQVDILAAPDAMVRDHLVRFRRLPDVEWQVRAMPDGSTRTDIPVQDGSVYAVSVAAQNARGVTSAWTAEQLVTVAGGIADARVVRLELTGQGTGTIFTGRDVHISWDGAFPDTAVAMGSEPFGAGTAQANPYLLGYVVRVYDADTGALVRLCPVQTATTYTYPYEENVKDGGPRRRLRFDVSIAPKVGGETGTASITVSNPPPPAVAPQVRAGIGALFIDIPPVADLDHAGYLVWVSSVSGFDPAATEPAYRGPQNFVAVDKLEVRTWFVRAAAYDAFGEAGLTVSGEVAIELADVTIDKVPPAVPTGLTLSSTTSIAASGEQVVQLVATWDRNGEEDFLLYEVQVREGSGNWMDTSTSLPETGNPRLSWSVKPGATYSVRLRGLDRSANASAYCATVTHTAVRDIIAPGAVTALVAEASFRNIFIRWTNPEDADLDHVELWVASVNDRAQATLLGISYGTAFTHSGLATGQRRWYWARAVDTSGNVGVWSEAADATTGTASKDDLEPGAPATPSGLTLSSSASVRPDGSVHVLLRAVWTANTETDLGGYEWRIKEGSGNYVYGVTGANAAEWVVRQATTYAVAVRAFDYIDNRSSFSPDVAHTTAGDTVAPGAPSALQAIGTLRGIYLSWVNPDADDLDKIEIWASTTAARSAATKVMEVYGSSAVHSGLAPDDTRYYWVRAVDTSGNIGVWNASAGVAATVPRVGMNDIAVGAVTADRIAANTITADQIQGNTITGDKILTTTSLPGTIKVGTTGVELSQVEARAADPAGRINANTTVIDPGKIQIVGSTTLADWRQGGDQTKIAGGAISANTISANKLEIGNRGLHIDGLNFTTDGVNQVLWAAGTITWVNDLGATVTTTITSGGGVWSSSTIYVYWTKGATSLASTSNAGTAMGAATVVLATYAGGTALTASYGRTIIDGAYIRTGTIVTGHMTAGTIAGDRITANTITADQIQGNTITGDKILTTTSLPGTIKVGTTGVELSQVEAWAADPAGRINANTTVIDPGKIQIVGSATLADWRQGGDQTKIAGGAISANTISANKLEIGNRGVQFDRFDFQTSGNTLSWSRGRVLYVDDAGAVQAFDILDGSYVYSSAGGDVTYLTWQKGQTTLTPTKSAAVAAGSNTICVGMYYGGTLWSENYGRTVISGDRIQTNAISAGHVQALAITTDKLGVGAVTAEKIDANYVYAGTINANQITAGTINASLIGDGSISFTKIGSILQSNNFVSGSAGWQIRKDGSAEFNGVVITRPIVLGEGDVSVGLVSMAGPGGNEEWGVRHSFMINTGLPTSSWLGPTSGLVANIGFIGPTTATTDPGWVGQAQWGVQAEIVPTTNWYGTAVLFLWVQIFGRYMQSLNPTTVRWRIYKVA